ncbi:MAG: response regulator [Opitutaceae bacterium]
MDTNLRKTRLLSRGDDSLAAVVPRLLVVDDDPVVQTSVTQCLRSAGYPTDVASDGEEGWELLHLAHYQLLITDNAMPRLTGIELLQRIRAAGLFLPAILASGTMPWDPVDVPRELQPLAILQKPYSSRDLLRLVREAISAAAEGGAPMRTSASSPGSKSHGQREDGGSTSVH